MKLEDLPQEVLESMPQITRPSEPLYFVTLRTDGTQGICDDAAARSHFGDDWDLVLAHQHPIIDAERIELTIH